MPSLYKPVLATYIDPKGKGVDLIDLCRRLIGEYQYVDIKPSGELISYEQNIPIAATNFSEVKDAVTRLSASHLLWADISTEALKKAIHDKTFSKLILRTGFGSDARQITVKNFYAKGDLSKKQIERLYWTLRLRWSCAIINQAVSHMIPDLKRRGYAGFSLPHGKMVTFESLHFGILEVVPKNYTIFHYNNPFPEHIMKMMGMEDMIGVGDINYEPTSIEQCNKLDMDQGLTVHHVVLAFNLPTEDDHKKGRLFVIDPTCSQFQASGPDGSLIHWGFWEDFKTSYPVDKIAITGYEAHTYIDPSFAMLHLGPTLLENVVDNLLLPSCNYCGDLEKSNGKRSVNLKNCSRCKKVAYCDSSCQKLAWPSHKLMCRSSDLN
ncbi:unnamed protein product [Orchesella dallaii]|uniref:MYND-type domain-containing protein n=1 Tax=Orchesella dallaii TaxID=48710 RepID=A0ABP1R3G3_9HEXA